MSYLELRDLQKRYAKDGPLIVNHMNLSVEKGEFIVLLGPSGCGKTATLRMISGLEDVSGGDILIDGESVLMKKSRDRGVSMIFQNYAVWPHMTVFENIAYPLKLQKLKGEEIQRRVEAAARATGIEGLLERYPARMSGGQRRRVAVSRSIVAKPGIFLMDEPLSDLDAKLRVTMRAELKRIHEQENSTTIFVTRDQTEAVSLADRIIVMCQGRIEQAGSPAEVYRNPASRFVASFIGTPPANFFRVIIEKNGDGLAAVSPEFRYRIPEALVEALAPCEGRETFMGVRPESMDISPEIKKDGSFLCDAVIDFAEPQGSCSILVTRLGGAEVKILSSEFIDIPENTRVSLSVKEAMFFDSKTGIRIC
jgi:multiple sugar transport system ATP-binding protein